MAAVDILSGEFAEAAAAAGLAARTNALASGHAVVFIDHLGRYVKELPDGRRFEVRLEAGAPRESHISVLGELNPVR